MAVTPSSSGGQGGEAALRTELEQQLAEAMATRRALQAVLEEQKRTEAALRASQALLNTTGELARIGGWELDAATLAVRWTDQVYVIHEVPVGDVAVLAKAIDFYYPDDRPQITAAVQAALKRGESYDLELRLITAKGRQLWVRSSGRAVSEAGRVVRLTGTFQDITARMHAELGLHETETRYRSLFNLAPDSIMLVSTEPGETGRILDANDLAAAIHGYTRAELLTMTVAELGTVDAAKHAPERIARLRAGERLVFEVEHRRKDGTVFPTEVTASGVEFAGKVCVLAFNRDITERKRAAAALRDAEERWQFALEAAQDGVWDWNVETGAVFFSTRWKSMLGFAEHEIGASFEEFTRLAHPDDVREFTPALAEHLAGRGPAYAAELRMRCKDGAWKWIRARGKVIERAADGAPRRMIGTHADIDEQKRREEHERVLSRRLDLALSAGRFGTFELDLKTGRSSWDERAFEIFGWAPQAEGPAVEEVEALVRPEDRTRLREILAAARLGHDTPAWEFRIRTAAGEERTIVRRAVVRRAKDGSGLGTTGVWEDVTAQRAAEVGRRIEQERHNTIFNAVGSGLVLQHENGAIIEANPAAERILGVTRDQMIGRDSMDARWRWVDARGEPIDGSQIPAMVTLRTGRPVRNHPMGVHWPDGTLVWLSVNTEPILNAAGRVAQVAVSFTDTTAEHRADERARIALRASRMGAWRHNPSTKVSEWDARMFEIYGCKDTPPEHATFMAMVVAADRPLIERDWDRVMAGQADFEYVFRITRPDGAVRSIRAAGTVQHDATGATEWVTGINEDVTERLAVEAEHQLDAQRLELAVRSTRLGIWRYDVLDRSSFWSEQQREIFGVERALTEPEFEAIIHPDDRAKVVGLRGRALAGERDLVANFRIIRPDGRLVHIYSNMALSAGPDGTPRWIAGISQDVTEQVLQNERERTLRDQLSQSQKLETLGTLAGGVAHDFNNLLTGMLGFVELSQHALPPDHQVRGYLDHVRGGGLRARDLVKRLLLFARRVPEARREPVQLDQLVTETLPLLSAALSSSIRIQRESVAGVGRVMGDAGQLQQVLMNLGVNAAHAIGARPGRITLRVRPAEISGSEKLPGAPGTYACLEVIDTGCGMDDATQARIFDPFFTTKKQGEGSGLGLSIVHGIVREHGGLIRVRSAPGQGTTFEIVLPVTHEAPAVVPPPPAGGKALEGAGRWVLVVDDEEPIRLVARALLLRAGFRVEVHADAESAARMFAAAPAGFAIVLADLSMPGRSGAELIRELRALRPELPAVLMSGDHDRYGRAAESETTNVILLSKPFAAEELFAALRRGLDAGASQSSVAKPLS